MSAFELVEQAKAVGVLLVLVDGRLTWEAEHEPPTELLADLAKHKSEVVAVLEVMDTAPATAWVWLKQLASLLECSPDYLLKEHFVDRNDLVEQHQQAPWRVARLIHTHPEWQPPSGHSENAAAEFGEQYARASAEGMPGHLASTAWRAARDIYHAHAVGGCPHCYPPLGRHCATGRELRDRYIHETNSLETHRGNKA